MASPQSLRAAEQAAIYERRRKMSEIVKARFARFGDDVLNVVLAHALQPRSMPQLIQQVGARATGDFDAQLEALWNYLSAVGPNAFMKRLEGTKLLTITAIAQDLAAAEGDGPFLAEDPAVGAAPAGPAAPAQTPVAKPASEVDSAPPRPHIMCETYQGPCRRMGAMDRRCGKDRRDACDSISKNRRYGKDRRNKQRRGRRKSDR